MSNTQELRECFLWIEGNADCEDCTFWKPDCNIAKRCYWKIDQQMHLLKSKGMVRLADDQGLPKVLDNSYCQLANVTCIPLISRYIKSQQAMLKADFRKVEELDLEDR